jgi:hypothetical protein
MLAIIILMIIAIILGGLAAYQLYAVTQTQNLLIQSQKNMSSIAMWKTMLISKAKAVGYENEIVLPYGDNSANYQTPPKWVYFNTKNPWGKDIIYCPISKHNSGTINNTVKIAGGSYGVETKSSFATVFNGVARNYVVSSNQAFGVNTTDILAFLISPTPSTTTQSPSCADISFDTSDNIYKVTNGLVEVITKGDVETFANLSMLAAQSEGTSSSSSAYLTTIEGDSSVTGNTFNANLNYITNSDINYAYIKLPSGTHSLESLNLGNAATDYNAVKKTLIIEGDADGTTSIVSPTSATLRINNYNVVLVNVNMYQNIFMRFTNSILKTNNSTVGNIKLDASDWLVTENTIVRSSNMSSISIDLKDSNLTVLNDNILTINEKSGNEMSINGASSKILVDEGSKIAISKAGNSNTIVLIDSKMTIDRGFLDTTSSTLYNSDIYVDEASSLNTYNGYITASGKSYNSVTLNGNALLAGTSIIPKVNSGVGITLYNSARLIMKGVNGHPASIGSPSARYVIPVHDSDGSYAGGLPAADGTPVTLYATGGTGSACAAGSLFSYSKESTNAGQTSQNDYDLINTNESAALAPIISKLNASNWLCNKL